MAEKLTKLEYRVWRTRDASHGRTEIKGHLAMADYHLRVNANALGIDPLTITTQIRWTDMSECYVKIEALATKETLSSAWEPAAELIGLQTCKVT